MNHLLRGRIKRLETAADLREGKNITFVWKRSDQTEEEVLKSLPQAVREQTIVLGWAGGDETGLEENGPLEPLEEIPKKAKGDLKEDKR